MSNNQDKWKENLKQGFSELTPDCWDEIQRSARSIDRATAMGNPAMVNPLL